MEYVGKPLSLSFSRADLRDVMLFFAEFTGFDVVLDPTARGLVTLSLRECPWDQALDVILNNLGLASTFQGRVIRVATAQKLAVEAVNRSRLNELGLRTRLAPSSKRGRKRQSRLETPAPVTSTTQVRFSEYLPSDSRAVLDLRLDRLLGFGRYGEVWRVADNDTLRALKLVAAPVSTTVLTKLTKEEKGLLKEFKASLRVSHPNVVHIESFGTVAWDRGIRWALLLELVKGVTIDELFGSSPRQRKLILGNRSQQGRFLTGLADGLDAIHRAGLVHRDLRAANVMISRFGDAKILDLGIALLDRATGGSLTRDLWQRQTPAEQRARGDYNILAPEQWEPLRFKMSSPSAASDVWALGLLMFAVLTGGRRPFLQTEEAAIRQAVLTEVHVWPDDVEGSWPEANEIVDSCLVKDPRRRSSLSEVRQRLGRLVGSGVSGT